MRNLKSVIAAAILLAAGATHADEVKVGIVSTFSGPFARFGAQMKCGVDAYQKINGTTVNGAEVKVIYRDDGGADPGRAKQLVEELVLREKVKFLGGFVFSPNVVAAVPIIERAGVPTVIFLAVGADLTRKSRFIVRTSYTNPQVVKPVANWSAKNGAKKVITIVSDYGPGRDAETYFEKYLKASGGEVVKSLRVPLTATDFGPYFEQILREKPDAVFMFAPGGPPAIGMINAWASRGLREAGIKMIVTAETQQIDLPSVGDAALGIVSSYHYTETYDNGPNKKLLQALKEGGKCPVPDSSTVGAYDGMHVIYEAIRKVGSKADGATLVEAMKGLSFESPRGPLQIDAQTRDAVQNVYLRKVEKRDGILVNINFDTSPMLKDPWKEENPEK